MISIQNNKIGKRLLILLLITLLLLSVTLSGVVSGVSKAAADQLSFPIPAVSDVDKTVKPNVLVIGTGGTISGAVYGGDPTNFQDYKSGTYKIADMVAQLPRKEKIADVNTYQFGNKGSGSYSMGDLYDLSLTIDQALKTYDSVVVTTGTDTMEDIAYFLDLTVRSAKPVVVTGAMRPWDVIGTDAPANLYNAIKLAGSGKTKWYGTVVMLNDVIQAAREVTKTNAQRLDTFNTPILGALGYIDQDNIRIYRMNDRAMKAGQPGWATPFDFSTINKSDLPIVELAYAYQDASGSAIKGFVQDGAVGIVTAGTGAGGISSKMSTARSEAIKQGVIFVTTTRTGSGTMYPSNSNGIIAGDNLNPQHARIMLLVAMAFSKDFITIKSWFETYGTHTIDLSTITASGNQTSTPSSGVGAISGTPTPLPVNKSSADVPAGSSKQLSLNDDVTISIPAGATDKAMQISIEKLIDISGLVMGDKKRLSSVFEIKKSITDNFITPVTLTFKFDPSSIGEGKIASVFYYDELKKEWIEIGGKVSGGYIVVETNHFTKFAVFATTPKPAEAAPEPIASLLDISGHWAEDAIKTAIAKGIVTGYPDSTFKPERSVTRAEFAVMLMKALKPQGEGTELKFTDKEKIGSWAVSSVSQAVKAGIISGYPDGTFRPDAIITRSEMTKMIASALKLAVEANAITEFADNDVIPAWAKGSVKAVKDSAIIQGRGGNIFAPNEASTRAEAVTIMIQLPSISKS
jgi:L-asparaginase type II